LNRSRLIFEADLATHPSLLLDYFKYLGKNQSVAFAASGIFEKNELPAYDTLGNVSATFTSHYSAGGIKFQTTRLQSSTFGVEALWSNMVLRPKVANEDLQSFTKIQYNNTLFKAFYKFDNFNDRYFPTRGMKAEVEVSTTTKTNGKVILGDSLTVDAQDLGELLQTNGITSFSVTFFPVIPLGTKLSLITKARLKISNLRENTLNLSEYDFVGGFIPGLFHSNEYYGVGQKEFGLGNYFYGRVGIQYEVFKKIYLQANFNYLDTEYPVTWIYPEADIGKLGDRYRRFGYGGFIGMKSPIGPIAFAFAKDHYRKEWKTSLIIGFYY